MYTKIYRKNAYTHTSEIIMTSSLSLSFARRNYPTYNSARAIPSTNDGSHDPRDRSITREGK